MKDINELDLNVKKLQESIIKIKNDIEKLKKERR